MIQSPNTAINNAYGTKYLFRGLSEIANTNTEDLAKSKEAITEYMMSGKGDGDPKAPLTPAKRKEISNILGKVIPNMTDKQLVDLQQEYIDATTFKTRKAIGIGIMSDKVETKTNTGTTYSKIALNKLGFSMFNFLKEYGDNTILTDDLIENNQGGYVVGGFELDVLPEGEERDNNINELQSKGIVHDMFNAKLAGVNHFTLDGLYDVNENFARFAKLDTELDESKMSKDEQNQLVRDTFKDDKYYAEKFRDKPLQERTYSHLKTPYKIKFKADVLAPKGLLKEVGGNISTKVAAGQGFAPTEEGKAQIAKANYKMIPVSEKVISKEIEEEVTDGYDNKVEFISQKRILYHGSPWSFARFNNQKIGTGEGAQADGWGI
jgi:hypothetical protein